MKKRSVFFIVLFIVPVIIFFYRYNTGIDLQNKIPTSAQAVLHLNVRQLEKCLLFDVVKHPFDYISFESSDSDDEEEEETILGQIDLPQDFFFYSKSQSYSDDCVWLSSPVVINDKEIFIQLLNKEGFENIINDGVTLLLKNNCAIICKKETVMVSFFNIKNKEKALLEITNSIDESQFYDEQSTLLQPILGSDAPINYVSLSGDFIQMTPDDGAVNATGKFESTLFKDFQVIEKNKLSVGLFETKIDTNHFFYKKAKETIALSQWNEKTNISIDSFAKYWDGSLRLDLEAIKEEKDTIITYDYDEDFNKVEIKAVQESNIPRFQVRLGTTKGTELFKYFSDRKLVRMTGTDTLFTGVPIYQSYVNLLDESFNISSNNELNNFNRSKNTFKINSYLNIEEYASKPLDFLDTKLLNNELIQTMRFVSLQYQTDNKLVLELKMKAANRNSLATMVLTLLNN